MLVCLIVDFKKINGIIIEVSHSTGSKLPPYKDGR